MAPATVATMVELAISADAGSRRVLARRHSSRLSVLAKGAVWTTAAASGLALGWGVDLPFVLGALVVLGSLVAALRRLDALVAVALVAFLLPTARFGVTSIFLSLRWGVYLLLLLVLAMRATAARRLGGASTGPSAVLLALVVLVVASTAWSVAPVLTLGRAVTFAGLVVAILLVRVVAAGTAQVQGAFKAVAALVALTSIAGFASTGIGGRYAGIFTNPNAMGVATALLFPVALQEAFVARTRRGRVFFATIAAVLAGEATAAGSRGGLLAVAAAYLVIGWAHVRPDRSLWRVVAFLLPVALAVVGAFTVADPHRFSTENSRDRLWGVFPEVYARHPVLGTGFGTTQVVLAPLSYETGYVDERGVNFHNSYLNLLTDIGALGAACFAGLVAVAWRRRKKAEGAMAAIVVAGLVSAVFESWMFSVGSGFAFVFWFALIEVASGTGSARAPDGSPGDRPTSRRRRLPTDHACDVIIL